MNLLAVDTSGDAGSVALLAGGTFRGEEVLETRGRHESALLPAARRLLGAAGIVATGLEAVAVGIGPGSFTGVRIAVTFAKTLSFALGVPVVGVCGLAALAHGARDLGPTIVVLEPGHATGVYGAAYDVTGEIPEPLRPAGLWEARQLLEISPRGAVVIGRAASAHAAAIAAGGGVLAAAGPLRVPALTIAVIAEAHLRLGRPADDPRTLEPLYLQAAAPEREGPKTTRTTL